MEDVSNWSTPVTRPQNGCPSRPLNSRAQARLLHSMTPGKATCLKNEAWLPEILRAVKDRIICSVPYESRSSGIISTYPVHPLAAFESEDGLYLYVELPGSGSIRILALECLQEFGVGTERFESPAGFSAEERLADPFGLRDDQSPSPSPPSSSPLPRSSPSPC
jgi:hypothetical protein